MRLICTQSHDGQHGGEYEIAPPQPGMTAVETLEAKANSHAEKGWHVERIDGGFRAAKEYPPGRWAQRRTRVFRLVR